MRTGLKKVIELVTLWLVLIIASALGATGGCLLAAYVTTDHNTYHGGKR